MQRNYPRMFLQVAKMTKIKMGSNLKTPGRRFQVFAVVTHKKSVLLSILVQPFVLQSLLILL